MESLQAWLPPHHSTHCWGGGPLNRPWLVHSTNDLSVAYKGWGEGVRGIQASTGSVYGGGHPIEKCV